MGLRQKNFKHKTLPMNWYELNAYITPWLQAFLQTKYIVWYLCAWFLIIYKYNSIVDGLMLRKIAISICISTPTNSSYNWMFANENIYKVKQVFILCIDYYSAKKSLNKTCYLNRFFDSPAIILPFAQKKYKYNL